MGKAFDYLASKGFTSSETLANMKCHFYLFQIKKHPIVFQINRESFGLLLFPDI